MSWAGATLQRYRDVIAPAKGPVAGYLINGAAISLKPLAAVFLLREQGYAFDLVGLVLAAELLGAAASMPLQGRAVDRFGARRVILPLTVIHVALLTAFVAAVTSGASGWAVAATTLAWGAAQPVLLPSLRAMWGTLFRDEQRDTAYAMQAVLSEFVYFAGPLLAALLAILLSPALAVLIAGALTLTGSAIFAVTVVARPGAVAVTPIGPQGWRRHLPAVRGQLRVLVIVGALGGVTSGAVEILLPAFAEGSGATEWAAAGFAVLAAGSVIGGLAFGARSWGGPVVRRYVVMLTALGVALLPLIAAPAFAVVCGVLFVAGLMLAPGEACLYGLVDDAAEDDTVVEANSWMTAVYTAGVGVGAGVGGWLLEAASISWAATLPAAGALLAALLVAAGYRGSASGAAGPPAGDMAPLPAQAG